MIFVAIVALETIHMKHVPFAIHVLAIVSTHILGPRFIIQDKTFTCTDRATIIRWAANSCDIYSLTARQKDPVLSRDTSLVWYKCNDLTMVKQIGRVTGDVDFRTPSQLKT